MSIPTIWPDLSGNGNHLVSEALMDPHNHCPVLIVPAADKDTANAAMVTLSGREEDGATFDQGPLSADGMFPASHFLATPPLTDEEWAYIEGVWEDDIPNGYLADATQETVLDALDTALATLGLMRVDG